MYRQSAGGEIDPCWLAAALASFGQIFCSIGTEIATTVPRYRLKEQAMLWDASALDGYAIEASDGRIGSVSDFLFEDTSWKVRWLVVDTGGWLSGRKVLLPLSALEKPDPSLRQ